MQIELDDKFGVNDLLLLPEAENNLLERDLIIALGIQIKPSDYLELLDPVSKGWPTCLQALVATALLVEQAQKVTFGVPLEVYTPHNIRKTLAQKAKKWLTDSQILKYETILITSPELELKVTNVQSPAQFSYGDPGEELVRGCIGIIKLQTKICPDFGERELQRGEKLFIDILSWVVSGKRKSGNAIISGEELEVKESGPLSPSWSA